MSKVVEEYMKDERKALIVLNGETLCVDFYLNEKYTNTVEFPDKSIHYVKDAAENYVEGILNFD